jgi:hypothetical protein
MPPLKETSEAVRNLVLAAAVVISGLWVFYQWDTLFPQTRAQVETAAAAVQSDVSGVLEVWLADPPPGISLAAACAGATGAAHLEIPLYGRLATASAADVPVLVRLTTLDIARYRAGRSEAVAGMPEAGFAPVRREGLWSEIPVDAVLGPPAHALGRGQSDSFAFMVRARFPFDCADLAEDPAAAQVFAVTAAVGVDRFDPETAAVLPDRRVEKGFADVCWIVPDGRSDCDFSGYPAPPAPLPERRD